jgi:IS30 family transposase
MAPKLSLEARMTIIELLRRGWSRMAIAESLGVTEGSVRYHERRRREGRSDGRVGSSSIGWRRWRGRWRRGCQPMPAAEGI